MIYYLIRCNYEFYADKEMINLLSDIIGYVLYFDTYSPAVGKTMFMEDFFVKPDHRRKGVGTMLFKSTVQVRM
jgi:GNAT superfamily N-acetyltransferase